MTTSHGIRATLGALLFLAAAGSAGAAAPARVVLPDDVMPLEYRLDIEPQVDGDAFSATMEIDLKLAHAARRVVLNGIELAVEGATMADVAMPATVTADAAHETLAFTFAHALAAGKHTLRVAYRGRIGSTPAGLFRTRYDTPQGRASALVTQFEPGDARRFLPCRDEPAAKAVFRLSATVPEALMAIGNMPVEASEALPGGRRHVRFAPTPRMSPYLLFFGLGDFERASRRVGNVDVGVIVKRGDLAQGAWALDQAAQILPWYDDWFATPYPLPKLDLIAVPGSSLQFSAMENWGAIMFFERRLLIDPKLATEHDAQRVFAIVAHEMAHQWFGDLVTMSWWDDLWLNEGYATWMQNKAAEHLHPSWKPWLRALEGKEDTMGVDARRGTHPVVTPIADVHQAETAFDGITYGKGSLVIRTLESLVGEDTFRDGVRRYLARHAYGNAVSDDLWRAFEGNGARAMVDVAHDFTLQAGVPMITELAARCTGGRTQVRLAQERFAIDDAPAGATRWRVPVTVAVLGGGQARAIVQGATPQEVSVEGCGPVVLNAGQPGYFRSRYAPADQRALVERFPSLTAEDQMGLFGDTTSLALAGRQAMASLPELARRVPPDADPVLVAALAHQLEEIDRLYDGLPGEGRWKAFARGVLAPALVAVGTRRRDGESSNATIARAALRQALAESDDDSVLADARALFEAWVAAPAAPLDPELRRFMLSTVAAHADAPTWERLHEQARTAGSALEQRELYTLLGTTRDIELARRAQALALSGEAAPDISLQLFSAVGDRHPALAFEVAQASWPKVQAWLDSLGRWSFMAELAWSGKDAALADRLAAWTASNIPVDSRQTSTKAEAAIRYQADLRRLRLPEIDRWLAEH